MLNIFKGTTVQVCKAHIWYELPSTEVAFLLWQSYMANTDRVFLQIGPFLASFSLFSSLLESN